MAQVTCYVNTDNVGTANGTTYATGYTTLAAAYAANFNASGTNLVTATENVVCYCGGSVADTTDVVINKFTTSATYNILITAYTGNKALKSGWDATRYRLTCTAAGGDSWCLDIQDDWVTIDGLQIQYTGNASFNRNIYIRNISALAEVTIKNCRIQTLGTTNNKGIAISTATATAIVNIESNIIDNAAGTCITVGVLDANILNNVIRSDNTFYGMELGAGSGNHIVKNNAIFNTSNDILDSGAASVAVQYNAADDDLDTEFTEATNIQPTWAQEFADPNNATQNLRDYTLQTGFSLENGGVAVGLSVDIDGDAWASPPSIGADEIAGASGSIIALATTHLMNMMRG